MTRLWGTKARRPLAHLVPNKRRLDLGSTTGSKKDKARRRQGMSIRGFAEDTMDGEDSIPGDGVLVEKERDVVVKCGNDG